MQNQVNNRILYFILVVSFCVGIVPVIMAISPPGSGEVAYTYTGTLTKSTANYVPSTSGISVSDDEAFGVEIMCDDASNDAIGVTVSVQTSFDATNWVTYSQTVLYPTTAAAASTMSISTDGGYYHASIHPMPCPYLRLALTEGSAQSDVTYSVKVFYQ